MSEISQSFNNGFTVAPSTTVASGASATLDIVKMPAQTITITGAVHTTTVTGFNYASIEQPTLSAASAVTIDISATLTIKGAPIAGGAGPVTISNSYALWIQAGAVRLDGLGSTGIVKNTNSGALSIAVSGTDYEPALTFNSGLSRSTNTITNDLNTGKGGGQTLTFGTASGDSGTIRSTSHATKGSVTVGETALAVFNMNMAIASGASAIWDAVKVAANTAVLSGAINITTAGGFNFSTISAPTISAASALTVTNAATFTILGAPIGAGIGPATITNAYALWVQSGAIRLDGLGSTGIVKNTNSGALSIAVSGTDYEPALTFNSGLTRSSNTITNDLNTGKSGGQTIKGGTGAGDNLTINSTGNATKGATFINDGSPTKIGLGISAMSAWSGAGGALVEGPSNSILMGASTDIYFNSNAYFASSWKRKASNLAARWQMFQGVHTFSTAPTGAADSVITWTDQITVGDTAGILIATTTSQKLGFFAATPVVQQNTTGTATGFTAGAGTTVTDQSTFTGAVGSTAYRISDIVKALKTLGLMAS